MVLHVELELPHGNHGMLYCPGDAIGIYCPNNEELVEGLLERLKLDGNLLFTNLNNLVQDLQASLSRVKGAPVDDIAHIQWPCTARAAFMYCCDITSHPRKGFLRMLAEYCRDPDEKATLYHLASRQGKGDYKRYIQMGCPTLLEILDDFPSCMPCFSHLLWALPPLLPRHYSAASSPSVSANKMDIAFSIVKYTCTRMPPPRIKAIRRQEAVADEGKDSSSSASLFKTEEETDIELNHRLIAESGSGAVGEEEEEKGKSSWTDISPQVKVADLPTRERLGICSNWLLDICAKAGFLPSLVSASKRFPPGVLLKRNPDDRSVLEVNIPIFIRRSDSFHMPDDFKDPIIMVGPGTGVAPFRGFLQHRRAEARAVGSGGTCLGWWRGMNCMEVDEEEDMEEDSYHSRDTIPVRSKASAVVPSTSLYGKMYLYYGCRSRDKDFLYQEDLLSFVADKTLHSLRTAFSREQEEKVYVQHRMLEDGSELASLLLQQQAR